MSDDLLERIKKVKALVERGAPGERENAQNLLDKLVAKYHIDLDTLEGEEIDYHWFKHQQGEPHEILLQQCFYKAMGAATKPVMYRLKGRRNLMGVQCTQLQAIEIELDYNFYSLHLNNEMLRLVSAFIQANKIFPPDAPSKSNDDRDSKDIHLQMGIERRTRYAQIESGG